MIDKNKEALKQQPLFSEQKIEEKQNLYADPMFAQPQNVIREADEEDEDEKELEEENRKLKQMYANLALDNQILRDVIEKKL